MRFQQRFRILIPIAVYFVSMIMFSCGIEIVIFLEPPRRTHDTSYQDDPSARYCRFETADSWNIANAGGYFQGTEIYYRIYERESDCQSDKASIDKYNDDRPANAAQYLQDSKKYYRLTTSTAARRPLINSASSNIDVRFRLQDYGADTAQLVTGGTPQGIPYRGIEILASKRSFDRQNIAAEDEDVQKTSSSDRGDFWCVNFYAVSYGYDTAFRTLYSSLSPLGYIKINKDS